MEELLEQIRKNQILIIILLIIMALGNLMLGYGLYEYGQSQNSMLMILQDQAKIQATIGRVLKDKVPDYGKPSKPKGLHWKVEPQLRPSPSIIIPTETPTPTPEPGKSL